MAADAPANTLAGHKCFFLRSNRFGDTSRCFSGTLSRGPRSSGTCTNGILTNLRVDSISRVSSDFMGLCRSGGFRHTVEFSSNTSGSRLRSVGRGTSEG